MDIAAVLAQIAEEELESMAAVPWASYARLIHERAPRTAGETYGCEIEGIYFDVGDLATWKDAVNGDIVLTCFAATDCDGPQRAERSAIITKN